MKIHLADQSQWLALIRMPIGCGESSQPSLVGDCTGFQTLVCFGPPNQTFLLYVHIMSVFHASTVAMCDILGNTAVLLGGHVCLSSAYCMSVDRSPGGTPVCNRKKPVASDPAAIITEALKNRFRSFVFRSPEVSDKENDNSDFDTPDNSPVCKVGTVDFCVECAVSPIYGVCFL